jgi:hypothetical protein
MSNPFLMPMWLMLAVGITVSYLIDIPYHTFWGLTAYAPWLITTIAVWFWHWRQS